MDTNARSELIRRYAQGYAAVETALAGITPAELDRCASDGWTPRQICHHLADSEMTSALRLRKLLAEEVPVVYGYDEELWARRLRYDTRPIEASLLAFRAARESTLTLLQTLTEGDWARLGWHTESGLYSMETWAKNYAAHAEEHADQIRRARGA